MLRIKDWNTLYENNRTRELKRLEWVPIPNRMDGLGYATLLNHPNGAAHFGAWVAILEICSRQSERGFFPHPIEQIPDKLSAISRIPADVFREVLPRLQAIEWLQFTEIPQEGAGIPQDTATKSQEGATLPFPSIPFSSVPSKEKKDAEKKKRQDALAAKQQADEQFTRCMGSALAAGVKLNREDVDRSWKRWQAVPEGERGAAVAYFENRALTQESQFFGHPGNIFRERWWTRSGPGRTLPAPRAPNRREMAQQTAAEMFMREER